MNKESVQYVDSDVTLAKFNAELEKFSKSKKHYRELGVFLLEVDYPKLYFGFAAPLLQPAPIVFATCFDFTNYDVEPISVQFIHPLTFNPLLIHQMPHTFPRKIDGPAQFQPLLQAQKDQVPFLCIPGIREYHEHPRHTGDSWLLYRGKNGEGSLCFLLDNIQLYGIQPIKHYSLQLNLNTPAMKLIPQPDCISK